MLMRLFRLFDLFMDGGLPVAAAWFVFTGLFAVEIVFNAPSGWFCKVGLVCGALNFAFDMRAES